MERAKRLGQEYFCKTQIAAVGAILPPDEIAATHTRSRNRELWATAEVLAALASNRDYP